jgi:DNA polymerase III epsilon subunit-like protein
MNEHLLRMNKKAKFCVFDFETEDLNLYTAKPWQFACVVGTNDCIIRKHDMLLRWPDLNISKEAEQITRFDRLKWEAHSIDPKKVFETIHNEFEEADWIAGHNILGYDIHVYRSSCRRLGIKPYPIEKKAIDTMACGKGIKLEIFYKPGQKFLSYQMQLADFPVIKRGFATLSTFAKLYDIHTEENRLHDALYDVTINFEVLKKMLWQIEI